MKRSELKKLIAPIVKECIQESLFEDGILSKVISEVMSGIGVRSPLVEAEAPPPPIRDNKELVQKERQKLLETKRKMLDAIGKQTYNGVDIFEGTRPISRGGNPGSAGTPSSPLAGIAPSDSGVDISSLMGNVGHWKQIINS